MKRVTCQALNGAFYLTQNQFQQEQFNREYSELKETQKDRDGQPYLLQNLTPRTLGKGFILYQKLSLTKLKEERVFNKLFQAI